MMTGIWIAVGLLLIALAFVDAFETVVLPRSATRLFRPAPFVNRALWALMRPLAGALPDGLVRQTILLFFGPVSLMLLIALWAVLLVFGFGLVHYGLGTAWIGSSTASFADHVYASGVNFFTLGLGDFTTVDPWGRFVTVISAAVGFTYLALVIGFIPVLHNAYSSREAPILMLEARAGLGGTGLDLFQRHAELNATDDLIQIMRSFERWSAEMLESFLSYPLLVFYRSQHERHSWLQTLTAVLDACALIDAALVDDRPWTGRLRLQTQATAAMCRHVVDDIHRLLQLPPALGLRREVDWDAVAATVHFAQKQGAPFHWDESVRERFEDLIRVYDARTVAAAAHLFLEVPALRTKGV
jgi:hypothetical protein